MLRQLTAALIATLLCTVSVSADDAFDRAARDGQRLGESLKRTNVAPQLVPGGEGGAGQVVLPGDTPIDVNQLVPGADAQRRGELEALYGDREAQAEAGRQESAKNLAAPSAAGEAYRAVRSDSYRSSQMDAAVQSDGALWQQTMQVLAGADPINGVFADCQTQVEVRPGEGTFASATTPRTCEHLNVLDSCQRRREVSFDRSQYVALALVDEAFASDATLNIPLESVMAAGTSPVRANATLNWSGSVGAVELTSQPSAENHWTATIAVTSGSPSATATITLTVDVDVVRDIVTSEPETCLDATDGWCEATWTCTDSDPRVIDGVPIDASFALSPLYPEAAGNQPPSSTTPVCYAARAAYRCDYNLGEMDCWDSPLGRQCHSNTATDTRRDTCDVLAANRDCRLVRTECAENARGHEDFCYVENRVYECREDVVVPGIRTTTANSCASQVRCLGDDCVNQAPEQTRDIPRTMTALMLVQHAKSDYAVVQENGHETRKSFPGEPLQCRKSLGGSLDCCTETDTGDMRDWVALYSAHERQGNAADTKQRLLGTNEGQPGSWEALQDPNNWNQATVERPLTSKMDSVTAGSAGGRDPGTGIGEGTQLSTVTQTTQANARREMSSLGWTCRADEFDLAYRKELGQCTNIGSYCQDSVLGRCITKVDTYCCFNSPISRAVREAAAGGQEGIRLGAFGTPRAPRCDGLAFNDLSAVPWSQVELGDMTARLQQAGAFPSPNELQERTSVDRLTGAGSSLGDADRPDLLERTAARLKDVPFSTVHSKVREDDARPTPGAVAEPANRGEIVFAPSYAYGQRGSRVLLRAVRRGSTTGPASAVFRTRDVSARAGVDYASAQGTVSWAAGEAGEKLIALDLLARTETARRYFEVVLDSVDGASAGTNTVAHVEVLGSPPAGTGPLPPPEPGRVTLAKAALGTNHGAVRERLGFTWLIRLANGSAVAMRDVTLIDELPQGLTSAQLRDASCSAGPVSVTQSGTTLSARCGAQELAPGASLELRLVMQAMPLGTYINRCMAQAAQGPAIEGSCESTVVVRSDAATPPPPAGCPAPPEGFRRDLRIQHFPQIRTLNWPDVYIYDFPQSGGPLGLLTMDYGNYAAIAFQMPFEAEAYAGLSHDISWYEAQIGGEAVNSGVYASFSPCPGDFRIPTSDVAPANDPTMRNACRNLTFDSNLQLQSVTLGVAYTIANEPNRCPLVPGETYYFNVILAYPENGFDLATDNPCQNGSPRCGIQLQIR